MGSKIVPCPTSWILCTLDPGSFCYFAHAFVKLAAFVTVLSMLLLIVLLVLLSNLPWLEIGRPRLNNPGIAGCAFYGMPGHHYTVKEIHRFSFNGFSLVVIVIRAAESPTFKRLRLRLRSENNDSDSSYDSVSTPV